MKEKKTIGFDILDNVGIDKIDRIGTDMDMLDEKTKKRILEMTKKRFNDAIKGENTGIYNTDINKSEEVVENVEVYNRSKIRRIMTGVVNTAAVVGLAAGSVFLIKNLGRGDIDKPVEPDLPAVSSTEPANQTQEEKARNQRIEEYIQELYNQYVIVKPDEEQFYNSLEIKYAYLDINNDSVSELIIRYNLLALAPDSVFMQFNYFDGTKYIPFEEINDTSEMAKIDLQNRRLYEIYEGHEPGYYTYVKTWENVEFSDNKDFFTVQDTYCSSMVTYEPTEYTYTHNNLPCTKEEYESAWAEYENCNSAELNFIPYTVKRESAEKTARNQFIEEYIQHLYSEFSVTDEDKFYDCLRVKYAYLDINSDSVDELLVSYDFRDVSDNGYGIVLSYFDGMGYECFNSILDTSKFDLQNRKLYHLVGATQGEKWVEIETWEEGIDFSDDNFTFQDSYCTYDGVSYFHNDEPCTKEEFDKTLAEYENCNSAKLNYIPYTVKKPVSGAVQTQTADSNTNNEETIQTTIATTNKPTQEVLDKARDAALKARFDKHDKNYFVSMNYAYYDINDDSVPELLISNEYNVNWEMEIYKFNGAEFEFKTAVDYNLSFKLCKSEKLIEGCGKSPSMAYSISRYDDELNFSAVDGMIAGYDFDENGNMYDEYRFNDRIITKEEFNSHMHECDSCEILSNDVEFLLYNTNDPNYNEKLSREQLINNFDSEGVYDSMCYAYIDLNYDGKSELIILCDDYDTNKATFNIYHWENDSYVLKTDETNFTFKIDLDNKRIYFVDDFSGTVEFMYYLTWDDNCNMKFVKQAYAGDEGFEELLAEYEACEDIYLDCIPC